MFPRTCFQLEGMHKTPRESRIAEKSQREVLSLWRLKIHTWKLEAHIQHNVLLIHAQIAIAQIAVAQQILWRQNEAEEITQEVTGIDWRKTKPSHHMTNTIHLNQKKKKFSSDNDSK